MGTAFSQIRLFADKWGVDNLLMFLIGAEMLIIYYIKRQEHVKFDRICTTLWQAVFFIGYALTHDLYRFKPLRHLLLQNGSFVWWNTTVVIFFGLILFVRLTHDIRRLLARRRKTEYVRKQRQKAVFDRYYRGNAHSDD